MFLAICIVTTLIAEGVGLYLGTLNSILVSLSIKLKQNIQQNLPNFPFTERSLLWIALYCLSLSLQRGSRHLPANVSLLVSVLVYLLRTVRLRRVNALSLWIRKEAPSLPTGSCLLSSPTPWKDPRWNWNYRRSLLGGLSHPPRDFIIIARRSILCPTQEGQHRTLLTFMNLNL